MVDKAFRSNMDIQSCSCRNKRHSDAVKSWSDLPIDVICSIMEFLYYADQVRFRAVCKSWRSNTCAVKSANMLPWIFAYKNERSRISGNSNGFCYLYDPSYKRKYNIANKALVGARIHTSKDGWILMSKKEVIAYTSTSEGHEYDFHGTHDSLFLYSPFTNKIIQLPAFGPISRANRAMISASPTSPECVIFVVEINAGKLDLHTCSPGDTKWTRHCFDHSGVDIRGLAYMDGVLYCAISSRAEGVLNSFNMATKEWKTVLSYQIAINVGNRILIESDGNLLMVRYSYGGSRWHVSRFDLSEMKLVELESLGNKLLFIDHGMRTSLSVPAAGKASELTNTIHHYYNKKFSTDFFNAPEGHSCPQPYRWIKESKSLTSTWIQPPPL